MITCGLSSSRAQTGTSSAMRPQTITTDAIPTRADPLLLGPGDVIDIEVFNTPELSGKVRLDQNGIIVLPIGGEVNVNGLTAAQAGSAIELALKRAQVMLDPHVTAYVLEYATQGVTVLGEVRSPGTYYLFGSHSLYDALSAAGGATATEGASITITHLRDPEHSVSIPVNSPNYSQTQRLTVVEPGDTVFVAKADMFFVVGDVGHPGAFYLQNGEPLTVLDALALASGMNRTANVSKASIVRPTATGAMTIPLNLDKVMSNTAPNPVLQASDVLVVPRSGLKVFLEYALPGATNAVTGAVASALVVR
jgi:polysaccharide export outer membrane protein